MSSVGILSLFGPAISPLKPFRKRLRLLNKIGFPLAMLDEQAMTLEYR